jgi:hypothetical protein
MGPKRRGIDLMKNVSDKRAADMRQIAADNERHFRKTGRRPTL